MTNRIISKIKRYSGLGLVFLLLILLDQASKYFSQDVFRNYFFAFSLPIPTFFSYCIYGVVLIFIFRYLWKNYSKMKIAESIAWVMILSGACSNVIERIVLGYVKDWIYITRFGLTGIYNLADGYILIGIVLLLLLPKLQVKQDL